MAVKKGEGTWEVVYSRVTIPRWGENITGWMTRPEEPAPGILVAPFAWGITGFLQSFCHRLTRHGWTCLAVDPYSRGGQPRRSVPVEVARSVFETRPRPQVRRDLLAGLEFLRKTESADADNVAGLAFGDGGPALLELASEPDTKLKGIALVGSPLPPGAGKGLTCPILGLYGAKDEIVPAESARAFAQEAGAAGHPVELLIYPDARENFLDDDRETYDEAIATDAWTRLTAFLTKVIGHI